MTSERRWRWILPLLLMTGTAMGQSLNFQPTQYANMVSGESCDKLGAYLIDDSDILQVYANPPQIPGGTATRDKCIIEVRTKEPNRRLKLYIWDVTFSDCGNRVEIYDGTNYMVKPSFTLQCESKPGNIYDSRDEGVTIQLTKQSPAALSYRFVIVVTTDQGPPIEFGKDMSGYNNNFISPGAIVGLAIAGGLIFLAIVAIAIYCIVKQRKKNLDAEKAQPSESTVYASGTSKVMFPHKRDRYESSSNDSHNSSYSSADGHNTYVNMNPDPKGRDKNKKGYENKAYASSEDGGHDRSRDSTGSDDISAGVVNGSFDSTSDAPSGRRYSKNQEGTHSNGSISRNARRGSARSKSHKRKDNANDEKKGVPPRDRRSRSGSGHRSGHRDSGRRSRSHGERGGSQRRSRSRSPHSQSSNHSAFDKSGHNKMYDISSMSKRSRESSNSSTSSRDSGDERNVSYDPAGRRSRDRTRDRGYYNRGMEMDDQYGSQV